MSGAIEIIRQLGSPIRTAPFVFLDIETSGLRPDRGGRITEIALVGKTGIYMDWSSADKKPDDGTLIARLSWLITLLSNEVVVGHNLRFDLGFIAYEANRLGLDGPDVYYSDTLGLARMIVGTVEDYQLGTLLSRFRITPHEDLHTARVDAQAKRSLFWKLVEYGDLKLLSDANTRG